MVVKFKWQHKTTVRLFPKQTVKIWSEKARQTFEFKSETDDLSACRRRPDWTRMNSSGEILEPFSGKTAGKSRVFPGAFPAETSVFMLDFLLLLFYRCAFILWAFFIHRGTFRVLLMIYLKFYLIFENYILNEVVIFTNGLLNFLYFNEFSISWKYGNVKIWKKSVINSNKLCKIMSQFWHDKNFIINSIQIWYFQKAHQKLKILNITKLICWPTMKILRRALSNFLFTN